jgi:hypothetical protein
MAFLRWLWWWILFFVPRFVTDELAVDVLPGGDFVVAGVLADLPPGERHDGVIKVTSLVWMTMGVMVAAGEPEVRTWPGV